MTGSLLMDSGTAIQVGNINNTSGATAMNVDNIQFYDSSSVLSIDGQNRRLKSLAGDQKFNWDTGVYSHDNGVTMLDAERGILGSFGLTGVTSLSWTTRELFSSNGGRVAQWGTGSGGLDINLDGGTITSVPTPVSANDAANKQYVDDAIAGVSIPEGTFVRVAGDTMTGNLGTQQVRIPFGTSPGTILYGDDTDTGPFQTGDGEYFIAANGNRRLRISQNFSEFLGPVTANSNVDIGGTLTAASINYPAGSVDLTTDVTGILPIANGGTGVGSWGATGTIPFNGSGGTLETDWASLNYSPDSGRLTVPQIFSNQTISSVTSAISYESARFQPVLSGTFAYITPGVAIGATLQGISLANAAQSFDFSNTYTGANSLPNGVVDFNIHHNFQENTTNLGTFKSMAFNTNFNDHDSITLVDSNNIVGVTSNVGNYKVVDAHDQFLAGATVNNYSSVSTNPTFSGGLGNYVGINDQPNFVVSPSSYIGINIAAQGGVTVADPIALNLSSDNLYSSTAFTRPKAIQHNGKGVFAFTSNTTLPNSHPYVVDSINNMISVVRTEPGSPLSGTGSLGWNFGGSIDAQSNVSLDPIGAGINAAGWVSLIGISSGVTVAQAGGTISVPVNSTGASSGATGGHLSAFKHYQAFPFFPGGGSNTLGDNWGFSVPSGFCGGITGSCYGIHIGDSSARSYFAGPVTLGLAADSVPYLDGTTTFVSSNVSSTELDYLDGATANIQTQLDAKSSSSDLTGVSVGLQSQITSNSGAISALQGVTVATWVRKSGDTMSGNLVINSGSLPNLALEGVTGSTRFIDYRSVVGGSSLRRWAVMTNGVDESGSNVGSNYVINRYDDSGNFLATALQVGRNGSGFVIGDPLQSVGGTMTGGLVAVATTMTGKILAADTLSSVTHEINPLRSNGGISALGGLWSGNVNGSGGGGALRLRRDTPSPAGVPLEGWRIALGGSAGDTNLTVRDVQNSATIINVTTARQVQFPVAGTRLYFEQDGGNTSLETIALSGTSTFISNTTITANSYPFIQPVGATNVSPWLIGVSTGTGYSVGATGAGTAKVFIIEGQ